MRKDPPPPIYFLGVGADLQIEGEEHYRLTPSDLKGIKESVPVKIAHRASRTVGHTRFIRLHREKILYIFGVICCESLVDTLKILTVKYNELRYQKDGVLTRIHYLTLLQLIYPQLSITTQNSKKGTNQFLVEVSLVTLGARRNTSVFYSENFKTLLDKARSQNHIPEAIVREISFCSVKPAEFLKNSPPPPVEDILVDLLYALQADDSWLRKKQLQTDYHNVSFNSDFIQASGRRGQEMNNNNNTSNGVGVSSYHQASSAECISVPLEKYLHLLTSQNQQKQQLDLLQFQIDQFTTQRRSGLDRYKSSAVTGRKYATKRSKEDEEDDWRPAVDSEPDNNDDDDYSPSNKKKARKTDSVGTALNEIRQMILQKNDAVAVDMRGNKQPPPPSPAQQPIDSGITKVELVDLLGKFSRELKNDILSKVSQPAQKRDNTAVRMEEEEENEEERVTRGGESQQVNGQAGGCNLVQASKPREKEVISKMIDDSLKKQEIQIKL